MDFPWIAPWACCQLDAWGLWQDTGQGESQGLVSEASGDAPAGSSSPHDGTDEGSPPASSLSTTREAAKARRRAESARAKEDARHGLEVLRVAAEREREREEESGRALAVATTITEEELDRRAEVRNPPHASTRTLPSNHAPCPQGALGGVRPRVAREARRPHRGPFL